MIPSEGEVEHSFTAVIEVSDQITLADLRERVSQALQYSLSYVRNRLYPDGVVMKHETLEANPEGSDVKHGPLKMKQLGLLQVRWIGCCEEKVKLAPTSLYDDAAVRKAVQMMKQRGWKDHMFVIWAAERSGN